MKMLNAVKNMLADVSSLSPSAEQLLMLTLETSANTFLCRSAYPHQPFVDTVFVPPTQSNTSSFRGRESGWCSEGHRFKWYWYQYFHQWHRLLSFPPLLGWTCPATVEARNRYSSLRLAANPQREYWDSVFRRIDQGKKCLHLNVLAAAQITLLIPWTARNEIFSQCS